MRRNLLFVLAVAWATTAALGDALHLKDGRILKGRVERSGDIVRLYMEYGTLKYTLDEIDHIEYEPRYDQEYRERLQNIDPAQPDELFGLSTWCSKHALPDERDQLLHKVLALDPDHQGAREALGYVRVGGTWTTVRAALRSADALYKLRRFARTDKLLDRILRVASENGDVVAALNTKAAVCLKLGRNGDALRAYRRAGRAAEDQRMKLIIEAKRDILAAHPDGLFLVKPSLPAAVDAVGARKFGLRPLADERVMQIALRESAADVVADGKKLLNAARVKEPLDPVGAAAAYEQAEQHFQAADALAPGIALSFRIETLRRRIALIRREAQPAYDRINADWAALRRIRTSGQRVPRSEIATRYSRIMKNISACQRAEQKILKLASGFPDDLASQIDVTQENLAELSSLREVIKAGP